MSDEDKRTYCTACGECVLDEDGAGEWYMVTADVWEAVMPNDPGDMTLFLCVECLEERLGRRLTSGDFTDAVVNAMNLVDDSRGRLFDRLTTPVLSPAVRRSLASYLAYLER
jgi:hypothetical protein